MIRWSKELELGDEIIDNQHKVLIRTLEEVYEACSRGEGVKHLDQTIKYLVDYADIHFAQEESMQKNISILTMRGIKKFMRNTEKLLEALQRKS